MALTYSPVEIRGVAAEPILSELFFKNKTVEKGLVSFEADIKANTIFSENENSVVVQPYTSGEPTEGGSLGVTDFEVTPAKCMTFIKFDPNTLRPSRFNKDMAAGAWNCLSNEFERVVLASYGSKISAEAEKQFYNGVLSATTKPAIALLTGDTSSLERAWVANTADATANFDGVVANLIYNHKRSIVTGTTVTSSNIAAEFAKLYADMDAEVIEQGNATIYAPNSYKQLINIYNTNATYRDVFSKQGEDYFYNGVKISFVPFAGNVMIGGISENIFWCTDLLSDLDYLKIDKVSATSDIMFVKTVFTLTAHIGNQKNYSLYVG